MDLALFAFYLFVCLVATALCFRSPAIALVLVLVLFPMKTVFQSVVPALVTSYTGVVNVLVGVIAIVSATLVLLKGGRPLAGMNNPISWCLAAMYTLMALSLLWTPTPDAAWYYFSTNWQYAILLYIVAPLVIVSIRDFDVVLRVFLMLGTITALLILFNPKRGLEHGRLTLNLAYIVGKGDYTTNPLALADMASTMSLAAALYRAKIPRFTTTLLQVMVFVLGLVVTFLSGSRGQLIAAVALVVVLWPLLRSRAHTGAIVTTLVSSAVVAAIGVSLYFFVFAGLIGGRWGAEDVSAGATGRFEFAIGLIEGYLSAPAFWLQGLGASAFNNFVRVFDVGSYYYPHNIAVEAIAEYGLLGFTLLAAICVVTARKWFRLFQLTGVDAHSRSLSLILFGMVLFHFFMSLKQGALLSMPLLFTLCLLVGKLATRAEAEHVVQDFDETESMTNEDQAEIERAQAEYEAGGATA